jgi:pimeloyl-ACP methyl ester carboxylesterase
MRRKITIVSVVLLTCFTGAVALGREAAAWAIVSAPNAEGVVRASPPPPEVTRVVQAEVGPPSASIEAWILDPRGPARATVLVLHGIRGDKRAMLGLGRSLAERGMRAVLVDLRGHGGSSGRFLTYGVVESHDLAQLTSQLDALGLIEGPLEIYGPSYGGAVALQLAAIEPRVRAVVSVSTFSSLRDVVPPYAEHHSALASIVPSFLVDHLIDHAGARGGFSPDATDARRAVRRTDARVLLVHGDRDDQIPFAQARAIRAACRSDRCRLLRIRGEDHMGALGSPETIAAAIDFLDPP